MERKQTMKKEHPTQAFLKQINEKAPANVTCDPSKPEKGF
jgi:hypothetical protein